MVRAYTRVWVRVYGYWHERKKKTDEEERRKRRRGKEPANPSPENSEIAEMHEWMPVHFGWGPSIFFDRGHFLVGRRGGGCVRSADGGCGGPAGIAAPALSLGLMAAVGRVVMYSAAAAGRQGRT